MGVGAFLSFLHGPSSFTLRPSPAICRVVAAEIVVCPLLYCRIVVPGDGRYDDYWKGLAGRYLKKAIELTSRDYVVNLLPENRAKMSKRIEAQDLGKLTIDVNNDAMGRCSKLWNESRT